MEKLGLEIPQFQLHRSLFIKTRSPTSSEVEVGGVACGCGLPHSFLFQVSVAGADHLGNPFSFVKEVTVSGGGKKVRCCEEPFEATVGVAKEGGGVAIEVVFHGHYGEPPLSLSVRDDLFLELVDISFDPFLQQWAVKRDEDEEKELSKEMEAAKI